MREKQVIERELEQILEKYDNDSQCIISDKYLDGGTGPLMPRLRRAAGDQLGADDATFSRYAIWANTLRDTIIETINGLHTGNNVREVIPLLTRVANSLSALSEIQSLMDPVFYNESVSSNNMSPKFDLSRINYQGEIIKKIADKEVNRVCKKVISELQKIDHECMQSSDCWHEVAQSWDYSKLKNIWDAVCVQSQRLKSDLWPFYEQNIRYLIRTELDKLDHYMIQAIWLQTADGEEWLWKDDDGEDDDPGYDLIDVNYILGKILRCATDWTNKRVRAYIDSHE